MNLKCLILLFATVVVTATTEYYDTILDTIDPEAACDDKTLRGYIDCFLDKGYCDEKNAIIRKILQEAVEQACAKCTTKQKQSARRFHEEFIERYPQEYETFKQKYDSEGKYLRNKLIAIGVKPSLYEHWV